MSVSTQTAAKPNIILVVITRLLFYGILIMAGYIIAKFQTLLTTF